MIDNMMSGGMMWGMGLIGVLVVLVLVLAAAALAKIRLFSVIAAHARRKTAAPPWRAASGRKYAGKRPFRAGSSCLKSTCANSQRPLTNMCRPV